MEYPVFKKFSRTFAIGRHRFAGVGIASVDALYLIMVRELKLRLAMNGAIGGGIMAVLDELLQRWGGGVRVETYALRELPPEILQHEDWPYPCTQKTAKYRVLIVPREAVDVIKHPRFSDRLLFEIGETTVKVEYFFFRGKAVRDYLYAAGWKLKWGGQVLIRTSQP
jgi:hypothetical protein